MFYSPAFIFSSGYSLGFGFLAGLRLLVLRQFQAFLASSPCSDCATSYHFSSSASPPWRTAFSQFAPVVNSAVSVLASGSNCAVKPTRLRRAAYFRSLDKRIFMKNIIAVFLLSELKGGSDGVNLAFEYTDGSALPKLGEFVYFGSPEVKFQISAREHLFQDDETVRIIYRLTRPQRVNESEAACLRAQLIQLEDM